MQDELTVTPGDAQQMYAQLAQAGGWSGIETQTVQSFANAISSSGGGNPVGTRPVLEQSSLHPHEGRPELKQVVLHRSTSRLASSLAGGRLVPITPAGCDILGIYLGLIGLFEIVGAIIALILALYCLIEGK